MKNLFREAYTFLGFWGCCLVGIWLGLGVAIALWG